MKNQTEAENPKIVGRGSNRLVRSTNLKGRTTIMIPVPTYNGSKRDIIKYPVATIAINRMDTCMGKDQIKQ